MSVFKCEFFILFPFLNQNNILLCRPITQIMKRQVLYIIALFAFISCQEDVKLNTPAFQGQKDNIFWRAIDSKATLAANGSLTIVGFTRNEKLTLKLTATNLGNYFLGINNSNTVTYVLTDAASGTITFSTGFGIGEGQIVITEYDALNKTITGNFKFNAENINKNPLAGTNIKFSIWCFL